jgi:hypothetical protein
MCRVRACAPAGGAARKRTTARDLYHYGIHVRACAYVRVSARSFSCIVRQVHLRHKGDGAPRVARPVQALGDPVRPRPPPRLRARRCRRCAAARGAAAPGAGPHHAALDAAAAALPVVGRGRAPRAHGWRARPTGARKGVGRSRPARPHGWRAGTRAAPSSRRCRRWSTGRASRNCECRRRRAHTGPADALNVAGGRAARALDVYDWVHVCVHMCVRSSACMCMRTYARMRRLRSSVRVGVRGRGRARGGSGSGRPLIVCHFVHFI